MPQRITADFLPQVRDRVHALVLDAARRLPATRYADLRIEVREEKKAFVENGVEKGSSEDATLAFTARVLAGRRAVAPGYWGQLLGAADMERLDEVLMAGLRHAHQRAVANAQHKADTRDRYAEGLGEALWDTALAPVPARQDTVSAVYRVDPRTVPLDGVLRLALEASKAIKGTSERIVYNMVTAQGTFLREIIATSEGADIEQSFAMAEGMVFLVVNGKTGPYELYDFVGHQRGWEVLTEGYRSDSIVLEDLMSFAGRLARDGLEVADAPPLKSTEGEVVVVTDPHYNTLVCHEVVGHPSEMDRALKHETSYAGRSWLLKSLADNQLGKQVASPLVSAYSDPTIEGFGFYRYDHEATPGRRAYHIKDGIYTEFLNNRQTAAIMGVEPNGSCRATEGYLVPLIRMTNTVFGPGDRNPQAILREVDHGYYVAGHRIPSVAESRENFRISAVKVYEIRNGEVGQLYRDGAVMADSRDYFMRVDAVGNDFYMYPIPNCGKGQPMQTKRMSNGGPTMRSVARLVGSAK